MNFSLNSPAAICRRIFCLFSIQHEKKLSCWSSINRVFVGARNSSGNAPESGFSLPDLIIRVENRSVSISLTNRPLAVYSNFARFHSLLFDFAEEFGKTYASQSMMLRDTNGFWAQSFARTFIFWSCLLALFYYHPGTLLAQGVALTWNPSTDPEVTGYKIYSGTVSHDYTNVVNVGDVTNTIISNLLPSTTYYFAATAYDAAGNESSYSTESSFTTASNPPPQTPVIQVLPGSVAFGTCLTGASITNGFIVENIGGGTLSGSASSVAPFNVLSGGSYSLGAGQTQMVSVVFNPTNAGSYNQTITLTGGTGTNVSVAGTATNSSVSNPVVVNPVIQVVPGSLAFGTLMNGTAKTNSVLVSNIGGGTLVGTASVPAPFSILSGGTYSLGSNQVQAVSIVFSPATSGSNIMSAIFTGGGGTNVAVSGISTNSSSGTAPKVSAITANTSNLGTNPAVLALNPGAVQLSATASSSRNDKLSWQWWYNVDGGPQTVFELGSGTNAVVNFTNSVNAGGTTNVWTLEVTDTKNGLSAQSQITIFVELPPPQGMQIMLF